MLTKGSVEIGLETRFGPNWPGVRCGARTKAGGECQRPAVKQTGRCTRHGGKSTGPRTQAGRIVDRLVRPKYNDALRFLDEGLASAEDLDKTCCMGLGYPDGPIERVIRGGLARHYDVSKSLYEMTGQHGYAPVRRAVVAKLQELA